MSISADVVHAWQVVSAFVVFRISFVFFNLEQLAEIFELESNFRSTCNDSNYVPGMKIIKNVALVMDALKAH
jgi:hypothetical protein